LNLITCAPPITQHSERVPKIYAQPKRIEALDSIRGLAALAVLFEHITGAFAWPKALMVWRELPFINILFDGRSAVTMFFVLSGFVLAHPYVAPVMTGQAPRRLFLPTFYIRRVTRIWIPWAVAFFASVIAKNLLFAPPTTVPHTSDWFNWFWHNPLDAKSILRQCTFSLHDARQLLLPQDWSLGIELKGSALIPFFIFLLSRSSLLLGITAIAGLILVPTGQYYVSFILGVVAAKLYWKHGHLLSRLPSKHKIIMLLIGLLLYQNRLLAYQFFEVRGNVDKVVWSIASFGCLLIIAASLGSRRIESRLNLPLFRMLGRISFSVYLLQFIVMLCLLPNVLHWFNQLGLTSPMLLFPIIFLAGVVVTVGIAAVMYRAVEAPTIQLGRSITRSIQARMLRSGD
jgi:peptidoglycan/LPS O-acetylase OafA/YrhL